MTKSGNDYGAPNCGSINPTEFYDVEDTLCANSSNGPCH